jgi:hypothetical protein
MDEVTRHRLIWGWLRLVLGFAQMALVALSVGALLAVGLHWITYVFVGAATAAALLSRLLYQGKPELKFEPDKK